MRLIDADAFDFKYSGGSGRDDYAMAFGRCVQAIRDAPTVSAVPLSELITLRDTLYDMDAITFRGLAQLNQLIAKYDGTSIPQERRWLETK